MLGNFFTPKSHHVKFLVTALHEHHMEKRLKLYTLTLTIKFLDENPSRTMEILSKTSLTYTLVSTYNPLQDPTTTA